MDVLTDTEIHDRCTDGPPKTPRHGGTDVHQSLHDIWGTYNIGAMQVYKEGHTDIKGHLNIWGKYGCIGGIGSSYADRPPHASH